MVSWMKKINQKASYAAQAVREKVKKMSVAWTEKGDGLSVPDETDNYHSGSLDDVEEIVLDRNVCPDSPDGIHDFRKGIKPGGIFIGTCIHCLMSKDVDSEEWASFR